MVAWCGHFQSQPWFVLCGCLVGIRPFTASHGTTVSFKHSIAKHRRAWLRVDKQREGKRSCMSNERRPTDLKTRRFTWRISSSLSESGTDGSRTENDERMKKANCVAKKSRVKQGRWWRMTRRVQTDPSSSAVPKA